MDIFTVKHWKCLILNAYIIIVKLIKYTPMYCAAVTVML